MTDIFNARQRMISAALMEIVHEVGKFDWTVGANGAHYVPASENPFLPQNIRCEECVFYADGDGCAIVGGEIESNAVCKFWTIPEQEITQEMPVSDEAPMDEVMNTIELASGDTPAFMGASAMEAMGLIAPMKSAMTMDEVKATDRVNLYMQGDDDLYAINTPDDVTGAYDKRIMDQDGPEGYDDFKAELIAIAIRKGQDYVDALPQAWRDEMQKHIVATAKRYLAFLDS